MEQLEITNVQLRDGNNVDIAYMYLKINGNRYCVTLLKEGDSWAPHYIKHDETTKYCPLCKKERSGYDCEWFDKVKIQILYVGLLQRPEIRLKAALHGLAKA